MVQLYVRIMSALRSRSEDGAVATEYGVLVTFIAIAVVVGATLLGASLSDFFTRLGETIDGWNPA